MSSTRFLQVLKSRYRVAVLVLALSLGVVALVSALLPRQYKASASVLVDMRSPDPLASAVAAAALGSAMGSGYMQTQSDVVQSERVTRRVIRLTQLDHDPAWRQRWREATDEKGSFEAWLVEQLQKKLEVQPTRESGVMQISFIAPDAQLAADIANAYVRAYIETSVELRVEPAKRYGDLFDDRVKRLRIALSEAQTRLSTYQQSSGVVATDERFDVETARLAELSSQLSAWQVASADARTRQSANSAKREVPEAAADPVLIGLNSELARQQLRVNDLRQRLGESHPLLQDAVAGVSQLQVQIAAQMQRLNAAGATTTQVNQSREAQLRTMLDEQRAKVLRMKRQRDDAGVLLRDVENAKVAYDAMQVRAAQSGLESANTQTNISVMQEATAPAIASSPKPIANMTVAAVIGTLLALAAVLLRESRDRKIRSIDDIAIELKQKMLIVIPRGRSRDSKADLVKARILGHHTSGMR